MAHPLRTSSLAFQALSLANLAGAAQRIGAARMHFTKRND